MTEDLEDLEDFSEEFQPWMQKMINERFSPNIKQALVGDSGNYQPPKPYKVYLKF